MGRQRRMGRKNKIKTLGTERCGNIKTLYTNKKNGLIIIIPHIYLTVGVLKLNGPTQLKASFNHLAPWLPFYANYGLGNPKIPIARSHRLSNHFLTLIPISLRSSLTFSSLIYV